MPKSLSGPPMSIKSEREMIPIDTMGHHMPDPSWEVTDAHGHVHRFDGDELPTLRWVVTAEGIDGDGFERQEGEWRCVVCGEIVEPHYLWSGPESTVIPGLMTRTLEIAGAKIVISEADYAEIVTGDESGMPGRAMAVVERQLPGFAAQREP